MTPSLRSHIADVLAKHYDGLVDEGWEDMATALLADPTFAAIIDLAAYYQDEPFGRLVPAEAQALLTNWRASRAEQEPER